MAFSHTISDTTRVAAQFAEVGVARNLCQDMGRSQKQDEYRGKEETSVRDGHRRRWEGVREWKLGRLHGKQHATEGRPEVKQGKGQGQQTGIAIEEAGERADTHARRVVAVH